MSQLPAAKRIFDVKLPLINWGNWPCQEICHEKDFEKKVECEPSKENTALEKYFEKELNSEHSEYELE